MKKAVFIDNGMRYDRELKSPVPDWEFVYAEDQETARAQLPDAEIVVGWADEVNSCCLDNPNSPLRWVQSLSAGVDGMPLDKFEGKGIYLNTASGVHAYNISESLFAMLLSLERRLPAARACQLKREWNPKAVMVGMGEAHGKTMGILGAGAIGQETALLAKAFRMRVLGLRRSGGEAPNVDEIYTPDRLNDMLAQCDYVVNILPHTPDTEGMVGEAQFASLKEGALYFNAGRGATTDTAALIRALESGRLAGAGLDVTDPEPLPADSPLWEMEQVILTPHVTGLTPNYVSRVLEIFFENFEAYRRGEVPRRNLVDYGRSY